MAFEDIALVDNHAHLLLRSVDVAFARFFTEAPFVSRDTLFYRRSLSLLAEFLGCAPEESAVVAARAPDDYARRLAADANVEIVLLDEGYPRESTYSVSETAELCSVRAHRILRIESLAEDLIPRFASLADLELAFIASLQAHRNDVVALKSVIAYRGGLAIDAPDHAAAAAALAQVREHWTGRLIAKPLLDLLFAHAVDWAADQGLPVQVHSGFGDRDLDLRLSNPLHLRPALESGLLGRAPLVLLHASYPFQREASYLASVYQSVYVDVSLASPLLAGPTLTHVLQDLLALAPVTRLLYGSDAWGIPEWLWLAARATRGALAEALSWLPESESRWAAQRILRENAIELYRLPVAA